MCIIIYKQQQTQIKRETLEEAWHVNSHGGGFSAYTKDGWVTQKGFMTLSAFISAYAPYRNCESIIHFRIATHGGINPENTHPFTDDNGLTLFHNGIMSEFGSKELSDTGDFFHRFLKHIPIGSQRRDLLKAVGNGDKFALIEEDGHAQLIGNFQDYEGLRVSNLSLKSYPNLKRGHRRGSEVPIEAFRKGVIFRGFYNENGELIEDTEEPARFLRSVQWKDGVRIEGWSDNTGKFYPEGENIQRLRQEERDEALLMGHTGPHAEELTSELLDEELKIGDEFIFNGRKILLTEENASIFAPRISRRITDITSTAEVEPERIDTAEFDRMIAKGEI